jgi:hypothetical protein
MKKGGIEMEKGMKRRIGVLVILGMLAMVICVPAGLAYSWSKNQHPGSRMEIIDSDDASPYVDEEAFAIAHDDIEEILFWVQEDGNVGIGTSSPTQKLHIEGNVRITGAIYDGNNQAGSSGQLLQSTGSGIDWVDPSSISDGDWTISGTNIYSAVSGNVGIGTTSPAAKLEVAGSGNPPCSIKLTDSGDSYNERASLTYADGTGSYLRLYDDSNNQNVLIRSYGDSFFLGGNIGIGTTSPGNF